jgi:hypothetical protein
MNSVSFGLSIGLLQILVVLGGILALIAISQLIR